MLFVMKNKNNNKTLLTVASKLPTHQSEKKVCVPSHVCILDHFFSFIEMECHWCHSTLVHHIPGCMELLVIGSAEASGACSQWHTQRNRVCKCGRAVKSSNEPCRFFCSSGIETRWTTNVHYEGVYTALKKDNSILFSFQLSIRTK